jgi:hypothetical protein
MNKSLLTNLVAAAVLLAGLLLPHPVLQAVGLFAVSGAITNWLAVHMLFERVPGLYGSGVVPLHFDDFRRGIRRLMMDQFFTPEHIGRFLSGDSDTAVDLEPVIDGMDLAPAFDGLVTTIEESSFGGMLAMIGGAQGLEPLRAPFIRRMKSTLKKVSGGEQVQQAIRSGIQGSGDTEGMRGRISTVIEKRLDELTPDMVKAIIQEMIREHLGWLVVWGGVFGGLIGLLTTLIP